MAVISLHQRFDFSLSSAHHPDGSIDVEMPALMRPAAGVWVNAVPCTPPLHTADAQEEAQHAQHTAQPTQCDSASATPRADLPAQPLPCACPPAPQHAQHAAHPPPRVQQARTEKSPFLTAPVPQPAEGAANKSPFLSVPLPQYAKHAAQKHRVRPTAAPQGLFSGKHRSLQTLPVPLMLREQHSMHRSLSGHSMGRSYSGHCG